jgi:hypothetical protein
LDGNYPGGDGQCAGAAAKFRGFPIEELPSSSKLLDACSCIGDSGCTFLDKIAAVVVQSGSGTTARSGYFYFAISFFPYMLLMRSVSTSHEKVQNPGWRLPIIGAVLGFGAYWLIL